MSTCDKLSEEQFIEACREFYMHLHNWNSLVLAENGSELVRELPSIEKVRAKLDKEFNPKKSFEPYTDFFTQEQIRMTNNPWLPYACYLADEVSFTRVIAYGSWSEDPLYECEIDIDKVMCDFPQPIIQYLVGFNIGRLNYTYKPGYDKVECDFNKFINSLDLATQIYKLMTHIDKYIINSTYYKNKYGEEFMSLVESKLIFSSYSEEKAARDKKREEELAAYRAEQSEQVRKESGILSHGEINTQLLQLEKEMQKLYNSMRNAQIDHLKSELKIYESFFTDQANQAILSDTNILEQIKIIKKSFASKLVDYKTRANEMIEKSEKLEQIKNISISNLNQCIKELKQSLSNVTQAFNKKHGLNESYEPYESYENDELYEDK